MGNLFSLLWKTLASIAAALGIAAVARKYTEPPPEMPPGSAEQADALQPAPAVEQAEAHLRAAAAQAEGHMPAAPSELHPEHGTVLRPGWSKPLPEKIPSPTYWPAVFGFGIMFVLWGFISNIFIFSFGFIIAVSALIGWVYDLRREYSE